MNLLTEDLAIDIEPGNSLWNGSRSPLFSSHLLGSVSKFISNCSYMNGLMSDGVSRGVSSSVEVGWAEYSSHSSQAIFLRKWDINGLYVSGQECLRR